MCSERDQRAGSTCPVKRGFIRNSYRQQQQQLYYYQLYSMYITSVHVSVPETGINITTTKCQLSASLHMYHTYHAITPEKEKICYIYNNDAYACHVRYNISLQCRNSVLGCCVENYVILYATTGPPARYILHHVLELF